jgi:hypothetical protein
MRAAWVVIVVWTVAFVVVGVAGLVWTIATPASCFYDFEQANCQIQGYLGSFLAELALCFFWLLGALVFLLVRYLADPRRKNRVEVRDIQCRAVNAAGVRCVWPIHGIERGHSDGSRSTGA